MAEQKKEINLGGIIFAFFTILIGVVFLSAIANEEVKLTESFNIVNESLDISTVFNAVGDVNTTINLHLTNNNWTDGGISSVENITGTTNLAETTDWVQNITNETIHFVNTTAVTSIYNGNNLTMINYSHYKGAYYLKNQPAARTVTRLIILFFALAVVFSAVHFTLKQLGYAGITLTK